MPGGHSIRRPDCAFLSPELPGGGVSDVGVGNTSFVILYMRHCDVGFGFNPGDQIHIGADYRHLDCELVQRARRIIRILQDGDIQVLPVDEV